MALKSGYEIHLYWGTSGLACVDAVAKWNHRTVLVEKAI